MDKAPDLEVVYRDPATLKGYDRNARTHSGEQVRQLRRSMEEFTFYNPILLRDDDTTIGAGHGRQAAALLKPALERVPTITLHGLTDEQWRALIIADNKLALNAGWDDAILKMELAELQTDGFDLSLVGFTSLELTGIFSTQEGNTDPDDTPAVPDQPVAQPGDVWRLGDHRLVCGDSTDPVVVAKALEGQKPHLMVTDPPYGVDYDADWRNGTVDKASGQVRGKVGGGGRAVGKVSNDDRVDWREAWAHFPGDVAYVWHGHIQGAEVTASLLACDFELRSAIVWDKGRIAISRGHYHWQHEACFYAVRKGANGHWSGDRKQSTIWQISKPQKSETGHSTQKPVECMARPIRNNSQPGDRIYEPFAGSFTTGIACQMNKRICHAIELNPAYVDVGIRRWEQFTGQQATLAADGRTFAEVAKERLTVI